MDNFARILQSGSLTCGRDCVASDRTARSIAYSNIKLKRSRLVLQVGPGGYLDEYVPFYFGPLSPMLFAYTKGRVTGQAEDSTQIIYFVARIEDIARRNLEFAFTDGHPVTDLTGFYINLDDLDKVDHELMKAKMWNDTNEDPDRQRRRQAEFLVYRALLLDMVSYVAVRNEGMAAWVARTMCDLNHSIPVIIRPKWYY
jgi:hypothetical protein